MSPGGLIDRLQASIQQKIELFRLEQRYTRRRNRRSTFQSSAVYVDGEYVYQTPNSTGSSTSTSDSGRINALHTAEPVGTSVTSTPLKEKRLSRRISSLAGFNSVGKAQGARQDWGTSVSVAEVQQR
ncbi:hypothetical protein HYQ45_011671 [Verticillium longisporum]